VAAKPGSRRAQDDAIAVVSMMLYRMQHEPEAFHLDARDRQHGTDALPACLQSACSTVSAAASELESSA